LDSRLALPVNTFLDGSYRIERVVGSGGFGITYEAEDIKLRTMVAIKEYYPSDFGDRDANMSVRPKSDRHRQTFEWGRANFLEEARTLARFEHPSIVRITRVFEANSTAYMVMRFERGQSFEAWLAGLGRPPTQEELDALVAPLLDALQLMHAADFLHRDIAPDNIIVRTDRSPVLIDFGSARRTVASMSRTLTGIVKAGYSPHEQYTTDSRLQGPWSDLYALGGSLYRAVTGRPPDDAALRVDEDHMPPASQVANEGQYRAGFLSAIDACLKVRHADRPRSVAQLRPMLLGAKSQPLGIESHIEPTSQPPTVYPRPSVPKAAIAARRTMPRWPAIAAMVVMLGGAYGGYKYQRWNAAEHARIMAEKSAEAHRTEAAEAARQQAVLEAERRQRDKEAADARQRQIDEDAQRRRADADAAEARRRADADAKRIAELAEQERRKQEEQKTGLFDGVWEITRTGQDCFARSHIFGVNIVNGTFAQGYGTVSPSGEFNFYGKTLNTGRRELRYTGKLNGASGAGTFYAEGGACRGTFKARRRG
jgi:serine/threonine protein kinase